MIFSSIMNANNKCSQFQWTLKEFNKLTIDELYNILNLRINVFMREQNCLYPETDYDDQKALHLWTTNNNNLLLAYARILPPNTFYQEIKSSSAKIGRVIVEKSARGTGLSCQLMEKAISITQALYSSDIEISAQSHLTHFYQKLGFIIDSKEYLEDDIPHIKMKLNFT
jgi:ElaA protein